MIRKVKTMLVAAATVAMMTVAVGTLAQAPVDGPGARGSNMGIGQFGRAGVIQRFGLADDALNLSAEQKREIDKAADGYVAAMTRVNERYPITPDSPPSAEVAAAHARARNDFNAAVDRVLSADQKKAWATTRAVRRGPGGGMSRPEGTRPSRP